MDLILEQNKLMDNYKRNQQGPIPSNKIQKNNHNALADLEDQLEDAMGSRR